MAIPPFQPPREDQLLSWSAQFSTKITASAVTFGLSAAQATAYSNLHTAFASAYAIAIDGDTNSRSAIAAKNTAKENLVHGPGGARELVDIIQAFPGTTNEMRAELNIKLKDEPTPVPVPEVAPDLSIVRVIGRTVRVRLRDAENPESRGKPFGVKGAAILTFVGEESPTDSLGWAFGMNATRNLFDIDFPGSVPIGSKVWVTAMWFNSRGDMSPAASPAWTCLADGLGQSIAA